MNLNDPVNPYVEARWRATACHDNSPPVPDYGPNLVPFVRMTQNVDKIDKNGHKLPYPSSSCLLRDGVIPTSGVAEVIQDLRCVVCCSYLQVLEYDLSTGYVKVQEPCPGPPDDVVVTLNVPSGRLVILHESMWPDVQTPEMDKYFDMESARDRAQAVQEFSRWGVIPVNVPYTNKGPANSTVYLNADGSVRVGGSSLPSSCMVKVPGSILFFMDADDARARFPDLSGVQGMYVEPGLYEVTAPFAPKRKPLARFRRVGDALPTENHAKRIQDYTVEPSQVVRAYHTWQDRFTPWDDLSPEKKVETWWEVTRSLLKYPRCWTPSGYPKAKADTSAPIEDVPVFNQRMHWPRDSFDFPESFGVTMAPEFAKLVVRLLESLVVHGFFCDFINRTRLTTTCLEALSLLRWSYHRYPNAGTPELVEWVRDGDSADRWVKTLADRIIEAKRSQHPSQTDEFLLRW